MPIYKHGRGRNLNPEPLDFKSGAITTEPHLSPFPWFQNTFSATTSLSDTHMLPIPTEKLSNVRDSSGKRAKLTLFIEPKHLSLQALTNATDCNLLLCMVYIFVFLFSCLATPTSCHIICTSAYYFTTFIFCEFVSCPNKPDEDWYYSVEISYTQTFSHCLISPCSSPYNMFLFLPI